MISYEVTGSTKNLESFLNKVSKMSIPDVMRSCGQKGVNALASATPQETGRASHSWGYEISAGGGVYTITWTNSDVERGFPVAIMLQYGYATGTGGYVQGRDYINPAIKPIFDEIADKVWKVVTSS